MKSSAKRVNETIEDIISLKITYFAELFVQTMYSTSSL